MSIENLCEEKGLRLTEQRRIIARVLDNSKDHPDVENNFNKDKKKYKFWELIIDNDK